MPDWTDRGGSSSSLSRVSSPALQSFPARPVKVLVLLSRAGTQAVASLPLQPAPAPAPGLVGHALPVINKRVVELAVYQEPVLVEAGTLVQETDLVLLVYTNRAELAGLLQGGGRGALHHLRSYWAGRFPLLLLQLGGRPESLPPATRDSLAQDSLVKSSVNIFILLQVLTTPCGGWVGVQNTVV